MSSPTFLRCLSVTGGTLTLMLFSLEFPSRLVSRITCADTDQGSWPSPVNGHGLEAGQYKFRQGFFGVPAAAGGSENKQQALLAGALRWASSFLMWGEGRVASRVWTRGVA